MSYCKKENEKFIEEIYIEFYQKIQKKYGYNMDFQIENTITTVLIYPKRYFEYVIKVAKKNKKYAVNILLYLFRRKLHENYPLYKKKYELCFDTDMINEIAVETQKTILVREEIQQLLQTKQKITLAKKYRKILKDYVD